MRKGRFYGEKNIEIQNTYHFSNLVGITWDGLKNILHNPKKYYNNFYMYQKNGKRRTLSAPDFELKACQDYILSSILKNIEISSSAHGFVKLKSVITNANVHRGSEKCLNIDIKDFFPSIHNNRVYFVFNTLCGYNNEISYILTRLCTLENCLPQGAPTSPMLSNIIAYDLDNRLSEYCSKKGLLYTRYADDITISGSKELINLDVLKFTYGVISSEGFKVNNNKTNFYSTTLRITGLIIDGSIIKIPRKYKKSIDNELFYLEKVGLKTQILNLMVSQEEDNNKYRKGAQGVYNEKKRIYLKVLLGKIMWIKSVERKIGEDFLDRFNLISIEDNNRELEENSL